MDQIKPQEVTLETDDDKKTFRIAKLPATVGRKIATQYIVSGMPKLGDYDANEKLMFEMLSFVDVQTDNGLWVRLTSRALVDNHVPSWEMLIKLEGAMISYNCSFFANGKGSTFFATIVQKATAFLTGTLMDSLGRLSTQDSQHGENSKQSTH